SAGRYDLAEERLHDRLSSGAVEGADQRHRQDSMPELDHRRRQLEQLLLLAVDHLLAALLERLGGMQAEPVEQVRGDEHLVGDARAVAERRAQPLEQRLLQREDEMGGLARRETHAGARARKVLEKLAYRLPGHGVDIARIAVLNGR